MSSRPTRSFLPVFIMIAVALGTGGCFGKTEEHLEHMDDNTRRMAEELRAYRDYIRVLTEEISALSQSVQALQQLSFQISEQLLGTYLRPIEPIPIPPEDGDSGTPAPTPSEGPSSRQQELIDAH